MAPVSHTFPTSFQLLKTKGVKSNPQEIAKAIIAFIPPNDFIEKVSSLYNNHNHIVPLVKP